MEYAVTRALPAEDISALRYAGRPDRRSAAFSSVRNGVVDAPRLPGDDVK
jgi:hypothetical protein